MPVPGHCCQLGYPSYGDRSAEAVGELGDGVAGLVLRLPGDVGT